MTPPRRQDGPVLAVSLSIACVCASVAGWLAQPALLAAATLAVIVLTLAFGWNGTRPGAVRFGLIGIFVLFTALIVSIVCLEAPAGPPRLWLGLPAPTALLVYALWPLGVLPALLYAFHFRKIVLPEDRLERFLSAHSRHRK